MGLKKILLMIIVFVMTISSLSMMNETSVYARESEIIGNYTGEYDGYSGGVVVRREIDINIKSVNNGKIQGVAVLRSSSKAESGYGVNASYYFKGTYDSSTKRITIQGYDWIMYPVGEDHVGNWSFVFLDGIYNAKTKNITGTSENGIWSMECVKKKKEVIKNIKATYHDGQMKKNYTDKATYKDQYFYNNSSKTQGGLARVSMLASATAYKQKQAIAFMEACNFNKEDIFYKKESTSLYDNDKVSFCLGLKHVGSDIIIAIWVKGTSADCEWISNFNVGESGKTHLGFRVAKDEMKKQINEYLFARGINIFDDNVKVWITGHSRGAAVANLYAADLKSKSKNVYAYTFATPRVSKSGKKKGYSYIKNYINEGDFVTELAPKKWGYKRFGQDKKLSSKKKNKMMTVFKKKTGKKYKGLTKKKKNKLVKTFLKYTGNSRGKYYKVKTYKFKFKGKRMTVKSSPYDFCTLGLAQTLVSNKEISNSGINYVAGIVGIDKNAAFVAIKMIYGGKLTPQFGQAHTQVTYIKWLEQMYK